MPRLRSRPQLSSLLSAVLLLSAAAALLRYPQEVAQAVRSGLSLCANAVIPSLFPFFVLSALTVELGLAQPLGRLLKGVMRPLFRVDGAGACALVLGWIGGYPVGARTAVGLYRSGQLSRVQTQRLLAFCNNSGPAFILGVVGAGVFSSTWAGLLLYGVHIAASVCVGILFRFYGSRDTDVPLSARKTAVHTATFPSALIAAVTQAINATLNICAFVVLFSAFLRLLTLSGVLTLAVRLSAPFLHPLGIDAHSATLLLSGLLEITSGVTALPSATPVHLALAAFLLGWGGLSVHCQVLSFLADSDISPSTYLVGKAAHGILCALFTGMLTHWFPLPQPVSAYPVQTLSGSAFTPVVILCTLWVCLLFLPAARMGGRMKKSGGKAKQNQL